MNCERMQELILTDYIDGQLSVDQKKIVDSHMAQCSSCRALAETARKTAIEPFEHSARLVPDASVWAGIKESIEAQSSSKNALAHWWENITSLALPRPAIVFAAVMMFMILTGTMVQFKVAREVNAKAAGEYLESLTVSSDGRGFDTEMEQYFL